MENSSKSYSVSIVTATLNESENISLFISGLNKIIEENSINNLMELVIVDDGSTDGTIEIIEKLKNYSKIPIQLVKRNKRKGTVDAQISGSRIAKGDYVIIIDADLQHPLKYIPEFLKMLDYNPDIVIGSRYFKNHNNKMPFSRIAMSRTAQLMAYIMLKRSRRLKDPLSGYFMAKRPYIANLKKIKNSYKLLLYIIAEYSKLKAYQIPIAFDKRVYGKSKITERSIKTAISYTQEIFIYYNLSRMAMHHKSI
jgi:dolichol-phosphate mannosyltransferase